MMEGEVPFSCGGAAAADPLKEQPYNDPKNPKILTFHPTMEEFRDFEAYIIFMESRNAHLGGIAKVVPPRGWKPRKGGYGDLDRKVIEAPILQNVKQTPNRGAYEVRNTEINSMTVKELREFAEDKNMVYSFAEEMDEIERNFWKQLTINPPVYGADSCGTLFDEDVQEWNVSNLPSALQTISEESGIKIQGVNTPYLYYGMWRAFFGWHTEDMDLYSINYIHDGAAKFWYGIAPHNGRRFERIAASLFPDASKQCAAFLRHKSSMISHSVLKTSGIPFNKILQQENEFIVTFPHAYHAGFNCGLNVAESTNFATERWIDYGKYTSRCYCQPDNVKIDMAIFIRKYRPDELAVWMDGTERGRHPEDERSSKRPPTSGPAYLAAAKKAVRPKKTAAHSPAKVPVAARTDDITSSDEVHPSSLNHKRTHPSSVYSDSPSLPDFGKRSCVGTVRPSAGGRDRLDTVMHRPAAPNGDQWDIPPPIDVSIFCETVSERVCRGSRRKTPDSSPTPPRAPRVHIRPYRKAPTEDVSLPDDQPIDLRCPNAKSSFYSPFPPWFQVTSAVTAPPTVVSSDAGEPSTERDFCEGHFVRGNAW